MPDVEKVGSCEPVGWLDALEALARVKALAADLRGKGIVALYESPVEIAELIEEAINPSSRLPSEGSRS